MINLKQSSSAGGTRNVYDNSLDFSSYGGAPGASGATNLAAVSSFNTAYAALSGRTRLFIAPGTYTSSAAFSFAGTAGVAGSKLTIEGYGVTLAATSGVNGINIGGGIVQGADNAKETRIVTVSAGTNTVTLVTAGQTSRFSVGQWCCVSGIDMQGFGDPPNLGIFEFRKIQSIGTGTLTFTEALSKSYKSTWPNYAAGLGGPATVFPMQGFFDQEVEVKGITFTDTGNGTYGKTRVIKWTDCTFNTYGPFPSQSILFQTNRCIITGTGGLEVDKCAHRVEFLDSTVRAVDFQSASINELYVNNVTQPGSSRWNGGASLSNIFTNLNTGTGTFRFNTMNYGAMGPTTMTNCSATTSDFFLQTSDFSDVTEEGGGVLSYVGGPNPPSNTTVYWAVPGQNCVLLDASNAWARSFQVSDVTSSGGRTYVTTNLPFPVASTYNGKTSPWKISCHPCADLTMVNCSGNSQFTAQSLLPAHTPYQSWTL